MTDKRTAVWINKLLEETSKLDETGIDILHACGAECSKASQLLKGAKKINAMHQYESDDDKIFEAFKAEYYNKPTFTKIGNKITLIFDECTCPMVESGVTNSYLCNCTVGYTINIFETLFGKPVKVKLLESILQGDSICKQEIYLNSKR